MTKKKVLISSTIVTIFLLATTFVFDATTQPKLEKIKVNSSGETYGPTLSFDDPNDPDGEPDLVSAIGIDGTQGYVRSADLNQGVAKSPEEAVKLMKSRSLQDRFIPLYDLEGETIIGQFIISPAQGENIEIP